MTDVDLREVIESDLPIFFEQQLDASANRMAAFTAKDPTDREAFMEKWGKIVKDETITLRAILFEDEVVGHVVCHSAFGFPEVSYWIGKEHWGKGIATAALTGLLTLVTERPLFGRAAEDNRGSLRVLEKCGFVYVREEKGFANARGEEVNEVILQLR